VRFTTSTIVIVLILTLISAVVIGLLVSCDKNKQITPPILGPAAGSGPVGGGETQRLELIVNPSGTITVTTDVQAQAKIIAFPKNSINQPMPDGTVVYWRANAGTIDPISSTTSSGTTTATLTFTKGYNGCSVVTARSGDVEASVNVCVSSVTATVTPIATATPSKNFILSANPLVIAHGGTSIITATATTNGQPNPNIQVNFTVSGAGTLTTNAGVTDGSGNASVTLIGNNTGTTELTATVTATTTDGRTGSITIRVLPQVLTLTLYSDITQITDCAAGDVATITAEVLRDGLPAANMLVTFTWSPSNVGTLSATSVYTNTTGQAQVTFQVPPCPASGTTQTVTVTATTGGVNRNVAITVTNP